VKNTSICVRLNSTNASRPSAEAMLRFPDAARRRALRDRERVDPEKRCGARGNIELEGALGPAREIHHPHRDDESDGSPDADRRELLDDVEATLFEHAVGHGVVEPDGRHVRHRIQEHDQVQRFEVLDRRGPQQQPCSGQVQDSVQTLRIQPAVRDDAQQARHEQRADTHRGVDAADLPAGETERDDHVAAEGDQPCPPDKELEEVHHCQAHLNPHDAQSSVTLGSGSAGDDSERRGGERVRAHTARPLFSRRMCVVSIAPPGAATA
jgi:hypothetical protein